jgi:hypothetical protein
MRADQSGERRILVVQGEYQVSEDPSVVLTTLLGSCVAACMRDPGARVGGMNHFLLPGVAEEAHLKDARSYGVHLMELLVNSLMQRGARRERLEAKLFGGGKMSMQQYVRDLNWPSTVPVAKVLDGTSRELRALAGTAMQIQLLVSQLSLEIAPTDTTSLRGLQQLDHVTQGIAGIASFLEALAATAPANCQLDAVSASRFVNVSDLALRLSFAAPANAIPQHRLAGDC